MFIDANIFLEVILQQKKSEECKKILKEISDGRTAFISSFAIDSIVLVMIRENAKLDDVSIFLNSLQDYKGLRIYTITIRDRMFAIDFIKKYKLDYEDALTLQAAVSSKSKEILSFDRHFNNIEEIKRIEP